MATFNEELQALNSNLHLTSDHTVFKSIAWADATVLFYRRFTALIYGFSINVLQPTA